MLQALFALLQLSEEHGMAALGTLQTPLASPAVQQQ
jgi:hypothetical protein